MDSKIKRRNDVFSVVKEGVEDDLEPYTLTGLPDIAESIGTYHLKWESPNR